ncbi:glycerophosphodiester phosphodiesterase [Paenibacillus sp. 1011MAR3C5]|uniref:glycerophosphodiester phosphodiesterase n=1 Tax=Paenibacillus sp. 1011MAR3C5 TaxID=1675787 RepID=UPI000E6BEAA4|nr:glycerophosphodiester phosphodiesterase family protein [Paenibacillus sp. 1011MAR3C5]RJE89799.1 glycerophosphodiester phosphodiesterase [Paenibacillus sp. 1011MAR3C5]
MNNPCVAHRGWSGRAPENTMAAFRMALEAPEVAWIELDVQLSKDAVPVVIHDYNLRRTTNGRGEVRDWTAAELASLDAGSWFSPKFKGESIPTLDEVLRESAGRAKLNIELKTDGIRYPGIEGKVLERVYEYGRQEDVVFTSFHPGTLQRLRKLSDHVRLGLILDGWRNTLLQELRELKSDFLSIGYAKLNPARMALLNEAGIQTMAWTVNDKRNMRKVAALDPDLLICTNYPDRWRDMVSESGAKSMSRRMLEGSKKWFRFKPNK